MIIHKELWDCQTKVVEDNLQLSNSETLSETYKCKRIRINRTINNNPMVNHNNNCNKINTFIEEKLNRI